MVVQKKAVKISCLMKKVISLSFDLKAAERCNYCAIIVQ